MIDFLRKIFAILILVCGLSMVCVFINIYTADVAYKHSQSSLDEGKLSVAMNSIEYAISKNPFEPNYYRGRGRILIASLVTQDTDLLPKIKMKALEDFKTAYNLNPNNLVTMRNLVPLYFFLATKDLTKPSSVSNIDSEFLPYTRDFFEHVSTVSPNDVGVYVLLAKYEKRLGLTQQYDKNIQIIKNLRPDLLDWYEGLK